MKSPNIYSTPQGSQDGLSHGAGPAFSSAFAIQDLAQMKSQLEGINVSAGNVALSLNKAFTGASESGRSFNSMLSGLAGSLEKVMVKSAGSLLSQGFPSILEGAFGGMGSLGSVAAFADGGIVSSPTYFGAGSSMGLMGERGAEAILPLARGPNGQLGVASTAGAAGSRPVAVTVNIQTPDIDSFRRSESGVAAALARAVARGRRSL